MTTAGVVLLFVLKAGAQFVQRLAEALPGYPAGYLGGGHGLTPEQIMLVDRGGIFDVGNCKLPILRLEL